MTTPKYLILAGAALLSAGALVASPAAADTLTFDDIATGSLTTAYQGRGVTFAQTIVANYGTVNGYSAPNVATGSSGSYFGQANAIRGAFSPGMVSQIVQFTALDVGAAGVRIDAFDLAGNLLGYSQLFGTDRGIDAVNQVSVSATDIHSFAIYQPLDGHPLVDGMLVDNISFRLGAPIGGGGGSGGAVPESASWAMMIAGFGLLRVAMRRRIDGHALTA